MFGKKVIDEAFDRCGLTWWSLGIRNCNLGKPTDRLRILGLTTGSGLSRTDALWRNLDSVGAESSGPRCLRSADWRSELFLVAVYSSALGTGWRWPAASLILCVWLPSAAQGDRYELQGTQGTPKQFRRPTGLLCDQF